MVGCGTGLGRGGVPLINLPWQRLHGVRGPPALPILEVAVPGAGRGRGAGGGLNVGSVLFPAQVLEYPDVVQWYVAFEKIINLIIC